MAYLYLGTNLLIEWLKTFIIFSIIDKVIIRRKLKEIIRNHDTYLSALVVAAFLMILRNQDLSIFTFLVWAVMVMVIYTFIRILFRLVMMQP